MHPPIPSPPSNRRTLKCGWPRARHLWPTLRLLMSFPRYITGFLSSIHAFVCYHDYMSYRHLLQHQTTASSAVPRVLKHEVCLQGTKRMAQERLFWGNSIAGNTIFSGSEDQGLGSWNQGPRDPGTRDLDWHTALCHLAPKICCTPAHCTPGRGKDAPCKY